MSRVLVKCMQGIGDQLYARPFIKQLAKQHDVFVSSVIPDLFKDISGLKFIDPGNPNYRTQKKAFDSSSTKFVELPEVDRVIDCHYGRLELKKHGIVSHLEHTFGFQPSSKIKFDLPLWIDQEAAVDKALEDFGIKKEELKNLAIVRPVTVRKEWICTSRAPNPNYINWCARMLKDAGYFVVSIADCAEDEEWIDGDSPPADLFLHKGELGVLGTLTLIKRAKVVVGGSGFIIPASVSAHTNLFIIFGGRGEYDNPHKVFDLRMDMKKIGWAVPDNFCRCNKMEHDCDKTIKNLDDRFFEFMGRI